jgi:ubiquinone/menaquinone biosynthesis C-methylase UbiE
MNDISSQMVVNAIAKMEKIKGKKIRVDKKKNTTKEFYDKWAQEVSLEEGHYKAEPWQFDRVHTMMEKVRGTKVLEVGAGDGYCSQILKSRGFDVTATEFSEVRLERMKANGINAVFADINKLPFEDATFDSVLAGDILEHLPSIADGLKELERVCKPDGIIIISFPVSKLHWEHKGHLWGLSHHSVLREGKLDMIVMGLERINREES